MPLKTCLSIFWFQSSTIFIKTARYFNNVDKNMLLLSILLDYQWLSSSVVYGMCKFPCIVTHWCRALRCSQNFLSYNTLRGTIWRSSETESYMRSGKVRSSWPKSMWELNAMGNSVGSEAVRKPIFETLTCPSYWECRQKEEHGTFGRETRAEK